MALTIDALKGLFKKLGGSDSGFAGVNTIPEAIDKVTSVASSGGGGSLPTPGAVGNVLTSTGDGWESAAPRGELAFTLSLGETTTCDVAVADIVDALDSKTPVFGMASNVGELTIKNWDTELNKVTLLLCIYEGEKTTTLEFVGESGTPDTWTYDHFEVNGLPEVSATDNGKFLGVKNGEYAFVDSTVILTDDGQGGYSATLDGDAVTLAELLTMAANNAPLRAVVEIDNGRMISAPITTWQTADTNRNASCAFTAPTINGTTTSVAYAVCENDGTGDVWTVGSV